MTRTLCGLAKAIVVLLASSTYALPAGDTSISVSNAFRPNVAASIDTSLPDVEPASVLLTIAGAGVLFLLRRDSQA